MKKILRIFTALALSLGILSGVTFTPQGITTTTQDVAYENRATQSHKLTFKCIPQAVCLLYNSRKKVYKGDHRGEVDVKS